MKKNKILIAAMAVILVAIAATAGIMVYTGIKAANSPEIVTQEQEPVSTTLPAVEAVGRPKTAVPASAVALIYSDYSEKSTADLAGFEAMGYNTVIFDVNSQNIESAAALFPAAQSGKLYFGLRADVSSEHAYLVSFTEKYNFDFVILTGKDESLSDYSADTGEICRKIKTVDPAMQIGLEPVLCSKASDSVTNLVAEKTADFVLISHTAGQDSAFRTAQSVWNEEACNLWLCHDLKGISAFDTDKASAAVELISGSAEMSLCKAIAFAPYSEIVSAAGTGAEIVKNYIQKRDTYLLDKEFSLTSHSKTSITVEQSTITFRGTSSPAYDLLCNGTKLVVAKNGDFSVDCELKAGKNTIKFEHKGKTYTYNVTYKIKLLKSVSPTDKMSVPGEMQIEVSAVAHKNASLSVSFNGKTYTMIPSGGSSDEDINDSFSDFTSFTATLETPASKESVQNLGKFKVTAKYEGMTESLNGASVNITAKEVVTAPPTTQPTTHPTTHPTTAPTTLPTSSSSSSSVPSSGESSSQSTDAPQTGSNTSSESSSSETSSSTETSSSSSAPVSGTLEKYFYTKNYGLGTARICEIIDDYVEVYPGNTTSTFSVPDCSPLLKTTVDYVKSTATYDGDTYYILASGVKVPLLREERLASGSNGKITHVSIKDGYVMPKNSVKVVSCSSASGDTVIVLEMNRPVAFNAKLLGQSYSNYNGNRPVVVSSLNCTGLEFTFSDTTNAEGSLSLINSVCKAGAWSTDASKSTATLTFQLTQAGKFYGFHYEYNSDGNLVITIKHKPASMSGYTIMLDPGHGGIDGGANTAVSATGLNGEKHINLSIAKKVKELLEAEGAKVVMTRNDDKWVCYTDRNNAVRNQNPDMFIAIHCDSSTAASAMGTSAYYYRAYSQPLAKAIHTSIVNAYKTKIYADKSDSFKSNISRGAGFYAFRVTRVEECPAILIEYGFVSNVTECQVLQSAANRDILAAATVEGIKNYIAQS